MMDDNSQSEGTPNPEGPEVLYVQGVSDPAAVGQYPQTQAVVAMVLSVMSIAAGCGLCTAIPGLMMANTALEITSKHPGHPCLLYTSPSPRDVEESRMPSSA